MQEEIRENQRDYGDFAILYRTNAQSRVMEETLLKANIPIRWLEGISSMTEKKSKIF